MPSALPPIFVGIRLGADADLSTIWIIEPIEVREETYAVRQTLEKTRYPLIGHLDRFVKQENKLP
jgi:hypothetical protein